MVRNLADKEPLIERFATNEVLDLSVKSFTPINVPESNAIVASPNVGRADEIEEARGGLMTEL